MGFVQMVDFLLNVGSKSVTSDVEPAALMGFLSHLHYLKED